MNGNTRCVQQEPQGWCAPYAHDELSFQLLQHRNGRRQYLYNGYAYIYRNDIRNPLRDENTLAE